MAFLLQLLRAFVVVLLLPFLVGVVVHVVADHVLHFVAGATSSTAAVCARQPFLTAVDDFKVPRTRSATSHTERSLSCVEIGLLIYLCSEPTDYVVMQD